MARPEVSSAPTSDPSSPFVGALPVIRPGSPEFAALALASGRGSF